MISLTQQSTDISRRHAWLAMLAILLVGTALRCYHLGFHTLWYDETFTAWVVAQTPRAIIRISALDVVHPPLYYILLSGWTRLVGNSEFGLRMPSAAVSLLGVPFLYVVGRSGWNRRTGLLAALLWACSPSVVWYAQEARMYAALAVEGLAAVVCLHRALREGSLPWLAANAVLNALGLYTHYFYLFLLMGQYVYLALRLRRHRRTFWRWLALNTLVALSCLPWLVTIWRVGLQQAHIGWIRPLSLQSVWQTFWELSAGKGSSTSLPAAFTALILAGGVVAAALTGRGRSHSTIPGLMWTQLLVPPLLVILISLWRPLLYPRFLQIIVPSCLALAAAGLTQLFRPRIAALLLVAVALAGILTLRAPYSTLARYDHNWKTAMHYLATHAEREDTVAFRGGQGWHGYWYYYAGPPLQAVRLLPEEGLEALSTKAAGSRRIWLVLWDTSRSCEPTTQFTPRPQDPLVLADTECSPEILIISYARRE